MDYNRVFKYYRDWTARITPDEIPDFSSENFIKVIEDYYSKIHAKQQIFILETVFPPDPDKEYNYLKKVGNPTDGNTLESESQKYVHDIIVYFSEASEEEKAEMLTALDGLRDYAHKRSQFTFNKIYLEKSGLYPELK